MKKAILISTMVFLITNVYGQDRIKEFGLSFYNLDGFGLNYKTGKPDRLWRLNSIYGNAYQYQEVDASGPLDRRQFAISFRAGREFRKALAEHLDLRYGFDVSFGFDRWKHELRDRDTDAILTLDERTMYYPGVNGVLGVNYLIKERIVIGGEVLPGFSYRTGTKKSQNYTSEMTESEISGFDFNLSSSSVLFVVAYRF